MNRRDTSKAGASAEGKNQMAKAVKKQEKFTGLKEATAAELAARRRLKLATAAGDGAAIAAAREGIQQAAAAVADLHGRRFEKNATMRGTTALTAIGELLKLVRQRRHSISDAHVEAIMAPLRDALNELGEACNEAKRRNGTAARAITFDAAEHRVAS